MKQTWGYHNEKQRRHKAKGVSLGTPGFCRGKKGKKKTQEVEMKLSKTIYDVHLTHEELKKNVYARPVWKDSSHF